MQQYFIFEQQSGGTHDGSDIFTELSTLSGPLSLAVDVNLDSGLKHTQQFANQTALLGPTGFQGFGPCPLHSQNRQHSSD